MKKSIIKGLGLFLLAISFNVQAQMQSISAMTQQRDMFKLQTDLMTKQISLETEKQNNAKISGKTDGLNSQSERKTDKFISSDPHTTAKDARKTAKLLGQTESANRALQRSNRKIASIERDIKKLQMMLDKYKYTVEVKEK